MRLSQTKVELLLGGAFVEFSFIRVGNKSSYQAVFNGGCTTADGLKLIECQFVVGHWFEGVVEVVIPPMNTPSLESMA